MSTEYKTISDRVIAVLNAERTDKLSENVTSSVTAVKKGQYTQGDNAVKPIVYVRFRRSAVISEMAGGASRLERLMFFITGATRGTTQEAAVDDCTNLMNNVENVLANYPTDSGKWGASYFGWGYSESDENPEVIGEVGIEPGQDSCIGHFQLFWSCDVKITTGVL